MNIALFNDSFPPVIDGVANVVVNYAKRLNTGENRAAVVTPDCPGADDSSFDFPVFRYPSIDTRKLTGGYTAGYPFSPTVEKRLRDMETELIHTHCPIASAILARSLSAALKTPLVFTYHTKFDIDIANIIKNKLLQEGLIAALVDNINACDEVWTVSKGSGENLRSIGYKGDYIVMKNGVDIPRERLSDDKVREMLKPYNIPDGVPVFIFVGRMVWYKGARIILEALAALKSQDYDFRMIMTGSGSDEDDIKNFGIKLGLADRIIYTGAVKERELLRALYCRADLFLFPSTFDNNPLVVREAAACSLPSVLVRGSSSAEGVVSGRNGFLIEENAASMASCLTSILDHPERMKQAGEGAANELYVSWDEAVAAAEDRYHIVVDNYKSGLYKKRRKPSDQFFTMQGKLMEGYNKVKDRQIDIKERFFNPYE